MDTVITVELEKPANKGEKSAPGNMVWKEES